MKLWNVKFILLIIEGVKDTVDRKLYELNQASLLSQREDHLKCQGQKRMTVTDSCVSL